MDFEIRPLVETDYDAILVGWWNDWGMEAPIRDILPENGSGGVMVLDGEIPICAGFLYSNNSNTAWINWIVSNKAYNKKTERRDALNVLIDTLTNISRNLGYKYAYALISNNSLSNILISLGFIEGITYNSEHFKKL